MKRHEDFFFFPPMGEPSQYEKEKKRQLDLKTAVSLKSHMWREN